jgi:hypothetical protein
VQAELITAVAVAQTGMTNSQVQEVCNKQAGVSDDAVLAGCTAEEGVSDSTGRRLQTADQTVVTTTLFTQNMLAAEALQNTLLSQAGWPGQFLGVTVNGVPTFTVAVVVLSPASDDSLSTGALVGIIVGSIVGVAIIAAIVFIMMKKKNEAKVQTTTESSTAE